MPSYKKDPRIEKVMALMNDRLTGAEEQLIDDFTKPELPVIFVIGTQRSGTTVLTQTLATLYNLSYPSNLIARFWRAPYIGAMLSRSLGVDHKNPVLKSDFGATSDINGPHEFSYFWRHWFPESAVTARPWKLSTEQQELLNKHFAAWQAVHHQPLLFKNLLEVVPNIQNLSSIFPTAVFIHIVRDEFFVVQSTYESRKKYHGDDKTWFGVKPGNYSEVMKTENPWLQIAEQVFYVKQDIASALSKLPENRSATIDYEDFISNPKKIIKNIEDKFKIGQWRKEDERFSDLSLKSGNTVRLEPDEIRLIGNHLEYLKKSR